MAQIIKFVRPEMAFNPEDTANLAAAYDSAIEQLHGDGFTGLVREIVAKRIIAVNRRPTQTPGAFIPTL